MRECVNKMCLHVHAVLFISVEFYACAELLSFPPTEIFSINYLKNYSNVDSVRCHAQLRMGGKSLSKRITLVPPQWYLVER